MTKLPILKKKIHSFLTKEEGHISKEAIIKTGILIGIAATGLLKTADAQKTIQDIHSNSLSLSSTSGDVIGTHGHSHVNG